MLGVIVNVITVILGSCIGLLLKKGIPERVSSAAMIGLGACTLYIGISGSLCGENVLILIAAVVLGAIVGTLLDIDGAIARLARKVEEKFQKNSGGVSVAQGLVSATLLFCVGSMTIMGSLESGINGDHSIIYAKSALDFVSSMMFAAAMGFGVPFAALFVLVFQGSLTLLAGALAPALSAAVVTEMSAVGGVILIGMGINLLGLREERIKVSNMLPAIFLPIGYVPLANWISSLF